MKLSYAAISLAQANVFVLELHRHHKPVVGHKFSIGAYKGNKIVGVVIVGRPVSRMRDDGLTLEVTRLCTDGTRNACSFLYGCAARAAFALGYRRIGTYTLPAEGGGIPKSGRMEAARRARRRVMVTPTAPARGQRADLHQAFVGG